MLILISTDVQYLQNIAFSFEKDLNCKNHSSSGSHQVTYTAQDTEISPNCLVRKLCGNCGNCAFPQNFHTKRLDEITVFYTKLSTLYH